MGVQLVLESPVEGQTDGQETGTQEDFTAPGEAGAAAALDLGRGWVGYVRWLLELFPKQVVLETWRWGSVTLDMSQHLSGPCFLLNIRGIRPDEFPLQRGNPLGRWEGELLLPYPTVTI